MKTHPSFLLTLVMVVALGACGGGAGTPSEAPDLDTFEARGESERPVVCPDVPPPEDVPDLVPDGGDGIPGELPPDAVWEPQPCQSHSDCDDGFCVEIVAGSGEFFCAPTCIEECPGDWLCKAVHLDGPDLVSICLPGDGCPEAPDGTPCIGSDPCKEYACQNGFCVGTPVELDLVQDGVDNDCDGKIDEDAYLGFRLLGGSFGGGPGAPSGAGWTLTGVVSATGFAGASTADGVVLIPGAP
jgi:hypothetical protein